MKLFSRSAFAAISAILLLFVINACKKPTEDIDIIVNTSSLSQSPVLLEFVNASSSSTTDLPSSFTATISGAGASLVQIDGGGTNFKVTNGMLPLSLNKNARPTASAPVVYNVYVEVPGFVPVSKTIKVTNANPSLVVIPMVEYAKPAKGAAAVVKQTALTAGTSAAVTVNTTTNATTTETSAISIASGTQLLDANSAVINSTQLKSNVVYFGTGNSESLNAFPGGFNIANAIGPNGQAIANGTSFVTAGLLSINMVAGSTDVKGFSKPVTLNMEINSNLVNPQTKQLVKVGDVIPVWSLNEETGVWKYERTTTISTNTNGKLAVSFPITHLSSWSANWYGANCSSSLTVTVRVPNTTQELNGDYLIALTTANNQQVSTLATSKIQEGFKTVLSDLPSDAGDLKVIVYSRNGNDLTKLGESATFSPCGQGAVDVTLSPQNVSDNVKTNVKIVAKCSTKQVVAYPTAWLTLKNTTTGQTTSIYMSDGMATANLVNGNSYSITTIFAGKTYSSAAFMLNKSAGVTIPSVNGLSGLTHYDASTNTVSVDATFILTDCN